MREILLEMYERLWDADRDKWAWNVILKDTLEKIETNNDTKRQGFVSLIEHYESSKLHKMLDNFKTKEK